MTSRLDRPKVYVFLGDQTFGRGMSAGFSEFANKIYTLGYEVKVLADSGRNVSVPVQDVMQQPQERKIVFMGYSLGGNGAAWAATELLRQDKLAHIDLLVGFDPTILAAVWGSGLSKYPLGKNVKRALCFTNRLWFGTGMLGFGHGVYARAPGGPTIETTTVYMDHLMVQSDYGLQQKALDALKLVG